MSSATESRSVMPAGGSGGIFSRLTQSANPDWGMSFGKQPVTKVVAPPPALDFMDEPAHPAVTPSVVNVTAAPASAGHRLLSIFSGRTPAAATASSGVAPVPPLSLDARAQAPAPLGSTTPTLSAAPAAAAAAAPLKAKGAASSFASTGLGTWGAFDGIGVAPIRKAPLPPPSLDALLSDEPRPRVATAAATATAPTIEAFTRVRAPAPLSFTPPRAESPELLHRETPPLVPTAYEEGGRARARTPQPPAGVLAANLAVSDGDDDDLPLDLKFANEYDDEELMDADLHFDFSALANTAQGTGGGGSANTVGDFTVFANWGGAEEARGMINLSTNAYGADTMSKEDHLQNILSALMGGVSGGDQQQQQQQQSASRVNSKTARATTSASVRPQENNWDSYAQSTINFFATAPSSVYPKSKSASPQPI